MAAGTVAVPALVAAMIVSVIMPLVIMVVMIVAMVMIFVAVGVRHRPYVSPQGRGINAPFAPPGPRRVA
jgi:uncharacterized membrane protein